MIEIRSALPHRSPKPLIVPWTWTAPASTAASELATARSQSLWQWMPTGTGRPATAAAVIWATSSVMLPPLVSQSATSRAPASAAVCTARNAYWRSCFQPSKKCSASKITSRPARTRYATLSPIMARFSSSVVRSTSVA